MLPRPTVLGVAPAFVLAALVVGCAREGGGAGAAGAASPRPSTEQRCAAEHRVLQTALDEDVGAGRLDAALRKASVSLAVCERDLGPRHVATARVRVERAWVLEKAGDYAASEEQAEQALSVFERELGEDGADVALALQVMGSAALDAKDYVRAKSLTLRLIALRERIGPQDGLAAQLGNLGLVYMRLGQGREAIEALARARDIARKNHPEDSREVALVVAQLGELHRMQGNVEAAEPLLVEALATFERVLGANHARVASVANNLAALYHYGRKDLAKAEPLYRRALAIHQSQLPEGHVYTAQTRMNLGTLLAEKGQWEEGRAMFEEGVAQMEKVAGRDAPEVTRARARFGRSAPPSPRGR